jgi:hypothetical protein
VRRDMHKHGKNRKRYNTGGMQMGGERRME